MADSIRHVTIMRSRHGILHPTTVTYREFISNERIKFKHIVTSFPISEHYGDWFFEAVDNETTRVTLTHHYHCYFAVVGLLLERYLIAPFFIGPHVEKMLKQMKSAIERWNN